MSVWAIVLAAGSGIPPMLAVCKSALAEGSGKVVLIYANRDENSVIFGGALRELLALAGPHGADLALGVAFAAEARALQGAVDGAIVLMHVGSQSTDARALPDVVAGLRADGYAFVTVEQLLQP